MGISDMGQGPSGDWLYQANLFLHEGGGLDVAVRNIQIRVLFDSKVLSSPSVDRFIAVPANSTIDTAFTFTGARHVSVSDLQADVTVQFSDATENIRSVSASFSGFGYWDY